MQKIDSEPLLRKLTRTVATVGYALILAGTGTGALATEGPAEPAAEICLALGAGGANGLAHVAVLETLDELGVRPRRIAGSSIGAVVGALYASGLSGREIRDFVLRSFTVQEDQPWSDLISEDAVRWAELIEVDLGDGGLLSSDGIMNFLIDTLEAERFEDLELPLLVVAGDLWTREQVVLREGDVASAVRASMALPGVFQAVNREGRTLVDGGTVNPVPFDLLAKDCDIVIAVDVAGVRTPPENGEVGYFETVFNAAKVMQQSIVNAKRQLKEPDLYLAPAIRDIRSLEFHRAEEVFEQARPAQERLRRELPALLGIDGPVDRP
ncbi:MAG: patatin-like phospholipase family protein [Xanthomonadales bacterium]|jgi:NTE family protein|nr:patatin-like phospholipase family protein [Xanthomonadales bacterium]